jgi:hypothetical protein
MPPQESTGPCCTTHTHQAIGGEDHLSSRSGPWSADPASRQRGTSTVTTRSRVKDRRPPRPPHASAEEASSQDLSLPSGVGLPRPQSTAAPQQRPQEGHDAKRRRRRDQMVMGFHPEHWCLGGNHSSALKRVTTPTGVVAAGAEALDFRPKSPPPHHSTVVRPPTPKRTSRA